MGTLGRASPVSLPPPYDKDNPDTAVSLAVKEANGNADARRERLKICRYDGFPTKETSVDQRDQNLLLSETLLFVTRSGRNPRLGFKLALGTSVLFLSTL